MAAEIYIYVFLVVGFPFKKIFDHATTHANGLVERTLGI